MRLAPRSALAVLCAAAVASCSAPTAPPPLNIDAGRIEAHLAALAHARSQGAAIGTRGEAIAAKYVADAFREARLKTTVQTIPYVRVQSSATEVKLSGPNWTRAPEFGKQYLAWTRQRRAQISVDAPVVFAGYGIIAPEFKWDDYKDTDVAGKIVIVLEDAPRNGDHNIFGVLGETYYGRRSYKMDEAARHGAAGIFVIHQDVPKGRDWASIQRSVTGEMLTVDESASKAPPVAQVEGWLNGEATQALFSAAGLDFRKVEQAARETNFAVVDLKVRASISIASKLEPTTSTNVIGVVEGRTPSYVIVGSRWNHATIKDPTGAATRRHSDEDGSATAVLLETAAALARKPAPARGIVFIVTTAHPEGLVGLQYYARHPLFPASKTIAELFIDGSSVFDESRHLRTIGNVFSGLMQMLKQATSVQGRLIDRETDPETLVYYRMSQDAFAAQGVPSMYLTTVYDASRSKDADQASRAFNPIGALRDADLFYTVATDVANATNWPVFKKPGDAASEIQR